MKNNILPSAVFDFQTFPITESEEILSCLSGDNQKKLLIVYLKSIAPNENLGFLKKVLEAIDYNIQTDVHLLELLPGKGFSFSNLGKKIPVEKLIAFGIPPEVLGIHLNCQKYKITEYLEWKFLFADDLQKIRSSKNLKAALWQSLQKLF